MEQMELKPFRVTLNEEPGDKFTLVFDCMAEDADDAAGQAEKTYPGCRVLNCTEFEGNLPLNSWLRNLLPGDQVFWCDPDHHYTSGGYTIDFINGGEIIFDDTILMLKNEAGSAVEVFARELAPVMPEGLKAVVFNGEYCGCATSAEAAIEAAQAHGNAGDEGLFAVLEKETPTGTGSVMTDCWVVRQGAPETVKLRLTFEVEYAPHGVSVDTLRESLLQMCNHAITNGMITGDTEAEVENYKMTAVEVDDGLSEEEVASFMLRRIENGDLDLEDISVRLARFGLMEAPAFIAEMRERMEMAKEDAE